MIFAPIPVARARGAILGHTLRLPGRVVLKKGRRLTDGDVERLENGGHETVLAGRLEDGDVFEDEAANRIARAVCGASLQIADAFTGRCNLFASESGVALIDASRVDRLNRVDEAVTVATLRPFARVEAGELVATVKIIPFAVPDDVVASCSAIASEPTPLLAVAPFRARRVGLVLTRLQGTRETVLDRAATNLRARLESMGSRVVDEHRCWHGEQPISGALEDLIEAGCELLLVLGASAVVDRRDVLPQAIERVGGRITHFGMPVDPGNLLLLAGCGGVRVIGVPGCARSLKRSGFDWVLERLLAGLEVGPTDVTSMGVGGLLQDIPDRPQPRLGEAPPIDRPRPRVAAVVLAAGRSRRMGERNKLLEEIDGTPMVTRVVNALLDSPVDPVLVVTGYQAEAVRAAIDPGTARIVHNPDFAGGMSTSLRVGVTALKREAIDGVLVCLGDMPWVRREHVQALVDAFAPEAGRAICVPVHDRKRGNPVLLAARFLDEMARIEGDVGARHLIETHADLVCQVPVEDGGVVLDVDTPDALEALRARPPDGGPTDVSE
jgi:molybdenum cofactor cytidylyltransferase